MLDIKKKTVILEMDRNDLWQLATALKDGIIHETRLKWVRYFQGNGERDFIHYVRSNHHLIFSYIEEMYAFLERDDIMEGLERDLIVLLHNDRGSGN
ncbi:hypothetical protein [Paenibacillus eucommiae]|uniref:Transcriptional regulator n=1 Tax=Paenibacillus eucommiae TaxID=1355755 RepID=A0ABS4ISK3_9BACL|nr:hypothetical protein [Paenibacillus eucommiae]MBP1990557.1 hypothetical protein [Paenibacillus eucommiae]